MAIYKTLFVRFIVIIITFIIMIDGIHFCGLSVVNDRIYRYVCITHIIIAVLSLLELCALRHFWYSNGSSFALLVFSRLFVLNFNTALFIFHGCHWISLLSPSRHSSFQSSLFSGSFVKLLRIRNVFVLISHQATLF